MWSVWHGLLHEGLRSRTFGSTDPAQPWRNYCRILRSIDHAGVPAGSSQSGDPRLEDSRVERKRTFSGDGKENGREDQAAVDHQAHDDGHHVHAQLPGDRLQVSNSGDLSCNQGGNANRGVPATNKEQRSSWRRRCFYTDAFISN